MWLVLFKVVQHKVEPVNGCYGLSRKVLDMSSKVLVKDCGPADSLFNMIQQGMAFLVRDNRVTIIRR